MEDTQKDGDDLLSIIVKEEFIVQEEDVQYVEVENRRAGTLLDTSLYCHECGRSFEDVQYLLRHLASCRGSFVTDISDSHSTTTPYSRVKEEEIDDVEEFPDLKEPSTKVSLPGHKKFECDQCGVKLTYRRGLIRHIREVHQQRIGNFKCKLCKKILKRRSALKSHLEGHLKVQSKKLYSCEICEKVCKRSVDLKKHMKTHVIECNECGVKFAHQASFRRHFREFHLGIRKFECEQCGKVFRRDYQLEKHLESHCNKELSREVSKKTHKGSMAPGKHIKTQGVKKFECDKCGSKMTYRRGFLRHYREVHMKIGNFKCKQCKKTFRRNAILKKHLQGHLRERSNKLYSCGICEKTYKRSLDLKKHMRTHVKKIECEKCGVDFAHQASFRRHYREVHVGIRKHKCKYCRKMFKRPSALKKHLEGHSNMSPPITSSDEHQKDQEEESTEWSIQLRSKRRIIVAPLPENKKFECDMCGRKLTHEHGFIRHYREIHLRCRTFECKKCKKTFKRKFDLQSHFKSHSNEFECHECGRTYKSVERLQGHLASSHGSLVTDISYLISTSTSHSVAKEDQGDQVEGSLNPKTTSEPVISIFKILPEGSKKFECNKCGLKFKRKPNLIRHYKEVHLGIKNFECSHCKKVFSRQFDLKIHLDSHLNKSLSVTTPEEYQKDQVEKFPDMKSITAPVPGCKIFKCQICEATLKHKNGLIRHYREVHLRYRTFECKKCGKMFKRKFDLQTHFKSHSNEFVCHECGRTYKSVKRLQGHLASSHGSLVTETSDTLPTTTSLSVTNAKEDQVDQVERSLNSKTTSEPVISIFKILLEGDNKFECNKCGVKFKQKPNVIRHYKEIHLRTKNFECSHCKKVFSRHFDLKMHMKIHLNKSLSVTTPKQQKKDQVKKSPALKKPSRSRSAMSIKKQECDKCGIKFAHHSSLGRHIKEFHLGIRRFKCEQCGKAFLRHSQLKIHLESHSKMSLSVTNTKEEQTDEVKDSPTRPTSIKTPLPESKKFECDQCGVKLTYKRGFMRHYKEIHHGKRSFECKICKKMFKRNSVLKLHLESHSNKLYSCKICEKVFKGPMLLKRHIKKHSPVAAKKFECEKCGKILRSTRNLKIHCKRVHFWDQ